mgnify:FL=1
MNEYSPRSSIIPAVSLLIWTAGTGGIMTAHSAAEVLNRVH